MTKRTIVRGFGLVELLVIVALIGLLSAILWPVMAEGRRKSEEARCINNLMRIGQAHRMYMDDYGERPPTLDRLYSHWLPSVQPFLCRNDDWVAEGGWAWSAWGQFNSPSVQWTVPISYGYFHSSLVTRSEWEKLENSTSRSGYLVDVLHGHQVGMSMAPSAAPHYQGHILRLCFDGSVVSRNVSYPARFSSYLLLTR
jgi:type II secretory pathway pseudopilin PulG